MENKDSRKKNRNRGNGQFAQIMQRLVRNKIAMVGIILLLVLIACAVFAPLLAPYSPSEMDVTAMLVKPCRAHPFGTDSLGRDILSRILYGARKSLTLGAASTLIGSAIGMVLGLVIGYAAGRVDMIAMRAVDVIQAIPGMLLAIIISTVLGAGFWNTVIAMSVGGIPAGIRSARALCLKEREMEYIEAARASNCSNLKIMFVHMFPNFLGITLVGTTMGFGVNIMGAASLSFIGLGIQPPTAEWGAMLSDGRNYFTLYPHLMLFPGIAIALVVLAVNLLGDGLRDAMDPKLKD